MHSSNAITMSEPSTRWISIDSTGPRKKRVPSMCDANFTPSGVIFRNFDRLKT